MSFAFVPLLKFHVDQNKLWTQVFLSANRWIAVCFWCMCFFVYLIFCFQSSSGSLVHICFRRTEWRRQCGCARWNPEVHKAQCHTAEGDQTGQRIVVIQWSVRSSPPHTLQTLRWIELVMHFINRLSFCLIKTSGHNRYRAFLQRKGTAWINTNLQQSHKIPTSLFGLSSPIRQQYCWRVDLYHVTASISFSFRTNPACRSCWHNSPFGKLSTVV